MAEEAPNNEINDENNGEEVTKSGNIFSRYGKIFLILTILLVQGGVSYAVIDSYYKEIYKWMDSISPEGQVYYTFENIIINPARSNGERYLILSIVVEVNSQADLAYLETNNAKVVDKINLILTKRSARELARLEEREEIKREMGIMINEAIDKKAVRNLFFTKYVLQ